MLQYEERMSTGRNHKQYDETRSTEALTIQRESKFVHFVLWFALSLSVHLLFQEKLTSLSNVTSVGSASQKHTKT